MGKTSKKNTAEKKIVVTNIGLHDLNKQLKQVISENTKTDITSNSISVLPGVSNPTKTLDTNTQSGAQNTPSAVVTTTTSPLNGMTYKGVSQDAGQVSTIHNIKGQTISVPDNFLEMSENPLDTVKQEIFDTVTNEMTEITNRIISPPKESLQISNPVLKQPIEFFADTLRKATKDDEIFTHARTGGNKITRKPVGRQIYVWDLPETETEDEELIKTNYKLNDIPKLAELDRNIELGVEDLNNKVVELGQKHNEITSGWIESWGDKAGNAIAKYAFDSWLDNVGDGKLFETKDLEDLNIREYLKINCPDFMRYAGLNTIDFADMFLNPGQQAILANIQNKVSDAISIYNNIDDFFSKETLVSVKNLVTFISEDLIKQVLGYLQRIFNKYLSPSFPLGLAKDYADATKRNMMLNIKDPRDILNEITVNAEIKLDDANNARIKMLNDELNKKLNDSLSEGGKKFRKKLANFDKYYDEIVKYLKYGPEYALDQVEILYKKYLAMGINEMNRILNSFDSLVYKHIENGGKVSGQYLAKKANDLQEKKLRKAIQKTNEKKAKAQIKANAVINKAVMNLLAQIGG